MCVGDVIKILKKQQMSGFKYKTVYVCVSLLRQAGVHISIVIWVSFKRQMWRVVTDSHQEDDNGADGHHWSYQEEAETVHSTSDTAPVIFLLWREWGC